MLKVGITGATGTLGRKIVQLLEERHISISAFDGDISIFSQVKQWVDESRCSVYIHSAALVPVAEVAKDISRAIEVNVTGTANIAQSAELAGAKLIYVSSSHVYSSSNKNISEADECVPTSLYGITKFQGEQWAEKLCSNTLIARVFSFFDPFQSNSFLVPNLKIKILSSEYGASLNLHGLKSRRDIIGSNFPAKVISLLAETEYCGVVNIGIGEGIEIGVLASLLAKELGREDISFAPIEDDRFDSLISDNSKLRELLSDLPPHSLQNDLKDFAKNNR